MMNKSGSKYFSNQVVTLYELPQAPVLLVTCQVLSRVALRGMLIRCELWPRHPQALREQCLNHGFIR